MIELVPTLIKTVVDIATSLLTNIVLAVIQFVSEDYWFSMFDKIIKTFTDVDWQGLGDMIMVGIKDGVMKGWNKVKDAISGVADGIKNLFKNSLDIESPSKVFKYYGEMIDEGLAIGIEDDQMSVNAVRSMSDDIVDNFNPSLAGATAGDIVIPVYLGNELLQTIVVDSLNIANYRSGGR